MKLEDVLLLPNKNIVFVVENEQQKRDAAATFVLDKDTMTHRTTSYIRYKNGSQLRFVTPKSFMCQTKGMTIDGFVIDCAFFYPIDILQQIRIMEEYDK